MNMFKISRRLSFGLVASICLLGQPSGAPPVAAAPNTALSFAAQRRIFSPPVNIRAAPSAKAKVLVVAKSGSLYPYGRDRLCEYLKVGYVVYVGGRKKSGIGWVHRSILGYRTHGSITNFPEVK